MAVPALALLAVTATGVVAPWMVFALVFVRGAVNAVDNPTRQSFVIEMVGPERVVNAVSLNSVIVHSARIVGPAIAGVLIATVGVAPCFAVNARDLRGDDRGAVADGPGAAATAPPAEHEPGAIRAALRYVRRTPELAVPLALMALVGTLGFNFQVILPLLAQVQLRRRRHAPTRCWSRAMGVGSVVGALVTGAHGRTGPRPDRRRGARLRRARRCSRRLMPTLALEIPVLALLGGAAVTFAASDQLLAAARGRAARCGGG